MYARRLCFYGVKILRYLNISWKFSAPEPTGTKNVHGANVITMHHPLISGQFEFGQVRFNRCLLVIVFVVDDSWWQRWFSLGDVHVILSVIVVLAVAALIVVLVFFLFVFFCCSCCYYCCYCCCCSAVAVVTIITVITCYCCATVVVVLLVVWWMLFLRLLLSLLNFTGYTISADPGRVFICQEQSTVRHSICPICVFSFFLFFVHLSLVITAWILSMTGLEREEARNLSRRHVIWTWEKLFWQLTEENHRHRTNMRPKFEDNTHWHTCRHMPLKSVTSSSRLCWPWSLRRHASKTLRLPRLPYRCQDIGCCNSVWHFQRSLTKSVRIYANLRCPEIRSQRLRKTVLSSICSSSICSCLSPASRTTYLKHARPEEPPWKLCIFDSHRLWHR